ncbi:glycyl-radical enzyme activating protein [Geosporobacter ferrireducens]|uniref:Glycyl-radical enzyme activating protein n=1 Tax=Geosporobacter ferrireducens TaxID=1424294 RepID=A0A1D8GFX2_9FIRM|nr:glycyl-radical enzyme activating protein [Geosporobacter ferrireducens]AOT69807.1 hypothetical protein Gferi_09580 [Geosporobacter ferrireducens]
MEEIELVKGFIFNVQHYCIHDGPGIRTNVFLKGCPLRCLWCQNPESQSTRKQLFFLSENCSTCGRCVSICPNQAVIIQGNKIKTNRLLCKTCGQCVDVCSREARSIVGEYITAGEVFRKIEQDKIFYQGSGGGVTISGGEPFAQPEFTKSIIKLCRDAQIHTAIETSGYARWEVIQEILQYVDLVLYDIKHMKSSDHKQLTGVYNELILENAKKIHHDLKVPLIARVPIIPGYNDSLENIRETGEFVSSQLGKSVKVHLLPFHRLGESKNERLECRAGSFDSSPPSEVHMDKLKKIIETFGLNVQIGG